MCILCCPNLPQQLRPRFVFPNNNNRENVYNRGGGAPWQGQGHALGHDADNDAAAVVPHGASPFGAEGLLQQVVNGLAHVVQGQAHVLGEQFTASLQSMHAQNLEVVGAVQQHASEQTNAAIAALSQQHAATLAAITSMGNSGSSSSHIPWRPAWHAAAWNPPAEQPAPVGAAQPWQQAAPWHPAAQPEQAAQPAGQPVLPLLLPPGLAPLTPAVPAPPTTTTAAPPTTTSSSTTTAAPPPTAPLLPTPALVPPCADWGAGPQWLQGED